MLEVEGCDYARLVLSPGLDRPLRRMADYVRFEGAEIDVTLRQVFQGRKKYRGILRLAGKGPDASLELIFRDGKDKDEQVLLFSYTIGYNSYYLLAFLYLIGVIIQIVCFFDCLDCCLVVYFYTHCIFHFFIVLVFGLTLNHQSSQTLCI